MPSKEKESDKENEKKEENDIENKGEVSAILTILKVVRVVT